MHLISFYSLMPSGTEVGFGVVVVMFGNIAGFLQIEQRSLLQELASHCALSSARKKLHLGSEEE